MQVTVQLDRPGDIPSLRFPEALDARLAHLLDRQDAGRTLTPEERAEAEALVDLADMFSLLRIRAERYTAQQ